MKKEMVGRGRGGGFRRETKGGGFKRENWEDGFSQVEESGEGGRGGGRGRN